MIEAPPQLVSGARMGGAADAEPARQSPRVRDVVRWAPLAVVGLAVLVAIAPGVFAPRSPDVINLPGTLLPPGAMFHGVRYWLGSDDLGRDVLSRVIWGTRVSVAVAAGAVFASGVGGTTLGVVAAIAGGWVGALVMRLADIVLSIPFFLLAVLVAAVLGPSLINEVIVLSVVRWPVYARLAFGQAQEARKLDYVRAAVAVGVGPRRLLWRHILPHVRSPIILLATLEVGVIIIFAAGLSFIGLGVQPPTPDWGGMISEGENYIGTAWWISVFPGFALILLVFSVNRIGDNLRRVLDPRTRGAGWRVSRAEYE